MANSILAMDGGDIDRVATSFFVGSKDRVRDLSGYVVLLLLSATIAAAGVMADSTATVIGAMIVAPLMRPILGIAVALVLVDRPMLTRSLLLVLGSAIAVVAIGFLMGALSTLPVVADSNAQVAGRVSPRLIDLVAALATGLVGAFAAVRSDVSDSLPGVAIAISLVPPLAVVGLTLESGETAQALGALLLFSTNVTAIVATGVLLFVLSGMRGAAEEAGWTIGALRGRTLGVVAAAVALVALPLASGSYRVVREQWVLNETRAVLDEWAATHEWTILDVSVQGQQLQVDALGQDLKPDIGGLRATLDEAGFADLELELDYALGVTLHSP